MPSLFPQASELGSNQNQTQVVRFCRRFHGDVAISRVKCQLLCWSTSSSSLKRER